MPELKSSFTKKTFIIVSCAKCGEKYATEANLFDCFESLDDAKQSIEMDDWEVKGNKAFCNDCK